MPLFIAIIYFLVTFSTFLLGLLVYLKDRKATVNRTFFVLILSVIGWITSLFFFYQSNSSVVVLWIGRFNWAIVLVMLFFFLRFVLIFPKENIKFPKLIKIIFDFWVAIIFILTLCSPLVSKLEIITGPFSRKTVFGPLFPFYAFNYVFFALAGILIIGYKLKKTKSKIEKYQLIYLILGTSLSLAIGFITNIVLYSLGYPEFSVYGATAVLFFVGFTAYAIFKYRLFQIKVILVEVLVVIIGFILLIQIFIAPNKLSRILNGTIFLLFCFFGYLLIRSVLREIQLKEQLEAANKELKRLDEAKTEFLSIASHQLRTPLTAIKGYLGMIEEGIYGEVPDKVKEVLQKINDSNERLIRLVNSLLDISRIELGRMQFDLERVDIEEMLENIVDEFHIAARKKGLKLVFEHPKEKLPEIVVDALKMRQVFLNLVDNAIKYTYEGEVIVRAELRNHNRERIRVSVADTGMGISRSEVNQIFKIYRRGTGVRLFPEGSGVGLYVAKKIVEAHNGKIWVKSQGKGRGSTFYVELPVKRNNGLKDNRFWRKKKRMNIYSKKI